MRNQKFPENLSPVQKFPEYRIQSSNCIFVHLTELPLKSGVQMLLRREYLLLKCCIFVLCLKRRNFPSFYFHCRFWTLHPDYFTAHCHKIRKLRRFKHRTEIQHFSNRHSLRRSICTPDFTWGPVKCTKIQLLDWILYSGNFWTGLKFPGNFWLRILYWTGWSYCLHPAKYRFSFCPAGS